MIKSCSKTFLSKSEFYQYVKKLLEEKGYFMNGLLFNYKRPISKKIIINKVKKKTNKTTYSCIKKMV